MKCKAGGRGEKRTNYSEKEGEKGRAILITLPAEERTVVRGETFEDTSLILRKGRT